MPPLKTSYFIPFKESIESEVLPECFTYPFYYEPHPLCVKAAEELQMHIEEQTIWEHDFDTTGKMFGVLLVKNQKNEVGFLAAFSGKLAGVNHLPLFAPPVYDMLNEKGFYKKGEITLNELNAKIKKLQQNPKIKELQDQLEKEKIRAKQSIEDFRNTIIESRRKRKEQRTIGKNTLDEKALEILVNQLATESVNQKNELKRIQQHWEEQLNSVESKWKELNDKIEQLKKQRKIASNTLQKKLFSEYHFLNISGEKKSLLDIFKETPQGVPPAAAGECAAPKLLQQAFQEGLTPIAMGEFWWGESPKSEIRKHKYFYPACQGKCQPILGHMLKGMKVDENPLLKNSAESKSIEILYEDMDLLVINKPNELLSVPGKEIEDSVYFRMKLEYPEATGPLIVHRLDMSTSGLMLIAKSKEAYVYLQRQFIKRSVKKRYVALLNGLLKKDKGIIDLPLRLDIDDRPRQLVCREFGKTAVTHWEVIKRDHGKTKVQFCPITGRTHQLRVHAAHPEGLNTAILGDDLYGEKSNRLHLHAEFIEFRHPRSKDILQFNCKEDF